MQSLIFGAVLFIAAVVLAALGIIGDLLYGQRIMVQRIFERVRRIELQLDVPPSHYEPGAHATGQEPTTGARAGHTRRRSPKLSAMPDAASLERAAMTSPSTVRARSPATPTTSTARPTPSSAA